MIKIHIGVLKYKNINVRKLKLIFFNNFEQAGNNKDNY